MHQLPSRTILSQKTIHEVSDNSAKIDFIKVKYTTKKYFKNHRPNRKI